MDKKSIDELTAGDVMQRDLVVVHDRDTLRDAMELMTSNHITGLPVVNQQGLCAGVITASDILNYEQENADMSGEANEPVGRHFDPETQQWESVRVSSFALEEFGDVPVQSVMSPDVISVAPETPLREVARKMRDEQVHRVLVLNPQRRLVGIISSFDFVRIVAEA